MRITYNGSGRMDIDGELLEPGENTEVSEERGTELLDRFPGILSAESGLPFTPSVPPVPSTPSAQSLEDTASSDSTTGD